MIKILNQNDSESILTLCRSMEAGKNNGYVVPGLFSNIVVVRRSIFTSNIICVGEFKEKKLINILCAAVPAPDMNNTSVTLMALTMDKIFLEQAMKILYDTLSPRMLKAKVVLNSSEKYNEILEDFLQDSRFKCEIAIDEPSLKIKIYSYLYH